MRDTTPHRTRQVRVLRVRVDCNDDIGNECVAERLRHAGVSASGKALAEDLEKGGLGAGKHSTAWRAKHMHQLSIKFHGERGLWRKGAGWGDSLEELWRGGALGSYTQHRPGNRDFSDQPNTAGDWASHLARVAQAAISGTPPSL